MNTGLYQKNPLLKLNKYDVSSWQNNGNLPIIQILSLWLGGSQVNKPS